MLAQKVSFIWSFGVPKKGTPPPFFSFPFLVWVACPRLPTLPVISIPAYAHHRFSGVRVIFIVLNYNTQNILRNSIRRVLDIPQLYIHRHKVRETSLNCCVDYSLRWGISRLVNMWALGTGYWGRPDISIGNVDNV